MTQNNNLSVLPFYTDIELQNHRKSYAYGEIYPLFAPADILLPFQIIREHRTELAKGAEFTNIEFDEGYLNSFGEWLQEGDERGGVTEIWDIEDVTAVYLENIPRPIGMMAVAYNDENVVLEVFNPSPNNGEFYTGIWNLPPQTYQIRVQTYNDGENGNIYQVVEQPRTIKEITLVTMEDNSTDDITYSLLLGGNLKIVPFENMGYDVIVYPANQVLGTNMQEGRHYIILSDGVQTWYSEIFTLVLDVRPYLKIEWWNVENLVFDAGAIVYKNPEFVNKLYLCTELGKPEYPFEEETENRNGYIFATKQISNKTYKCTILAPEYLCDVMRLIRLSDYVKITDKYGRIYWADTFLITPKWQTQGDLASIEIEFTTNTVVKKNGLAYLRPESENK